MVKGSTYSPRYTRRGWASYRSCSLIIWMCSIGFMSFNSWTLQVVGLMIWFKVLGTLLLRLNWICSYWRSSPIEMLGITEFTGYSSSSGWTRLYGTIINIVRMHDWFITKLFWFIRLLLIQPQAWFEYSFRLWWTYFVSSTWTLLGCTAQHATICKKWHLWYFSFGQPNLVRYILEQILHHIIHVVLFGELHFHSITYRFFAFLIYAFCI